MNATTDSRVTARGRFAIGVAVVVGLASAAGAVALVTMMVDETQFERPSAQFDALTAELAAVSGVGGVEGSRWVEAPFFVDPHAWVSLTVDEHAVTEAMDAACASGYPEPVSWGLEVTTASGGVIRLPSEGQAGSCPAFGFDAERLVGALTDVAPGLDVQASMWDAERLGFVAVDEIGIAPLLPLVAHADDLVAAAGLAPATAVEINSMTLSIRVAPGEGDRYVALLSDLADHPAIQSFATGSAETWADGVARVQVVTAGAADRAAIEAAVRASGLDIADLPVTFIEQ